MLAIISLCCTGLLLLAVSIPSHLIIYSSVDRTYSTNMLIGNLTGISSQVTSAFSSPYDISRVCFCQSMQQQWKYVSSAFILLNIKLLMTI
ncbi:hypothetical protein PVAP13_9NG551384 [Panicum virgatum]|uniref:Uncharacterized protein n=1 Tax=Panicum virgatum TaxID=38727 RepID=A0A8T0MTA4_PANVG|nr:hypothetical protein PVAP13_9NG551384 [Panicum virgatum]